MKIEGSHALAAPRERVYELLTDHVALAKLMPGCEKLEPAGKDTYAVKMKLGIAALSGSYQGTVKLSEQKPPESLRLAVQARAPGGIAEGGGSLKLEEKAGKTTVHYAGEVKVSGMLASVGQRLLDSAARMVIAQFFKNLEKELAS
ncbi:MAG: SRPBCC family protein [Candidatus Acidiferrales bacterium]